MKRSKKHRVKQELPETSTSRTVNPKEHDLAYYIHDRVELMHQVFSVLKPKELKAMAPECVRHISINDLQELCMEELLGISSKRLCAILDGASPPSDTESSSESEKLETISLDSISSDEEILSQVSSKKSKKHKHRSKCKPKKRKSKDQDDEDKDQADRSRRAGLTVLELLELQARARAIRAQLQQEQACAVSTGRPSESNTGNSADDEVEIKEEAAEVVEISSEDEKPNIQELEERVATTRNEMTSGNSSNSKTVTKKVKDLIIIVPKSNTSRKIKLKRNTSNNSKIIEKNAITEKDLPKTNSSVDAVEQTSTSAIQISSTKLAVDAIAKQTANSKVEGSKGYLGNSKDKNKSKDKKKKRRNNKQNDKEGSDHDEIMLQLSDSEKMDLLEDLEGKKSEKCSDTADSSSDSSDEESVKEDESDKVTNQQPRNTKIYKPDENIVDIGNPRENENNNELVSIEQNIFNSGQSNEVESCSNKTPSDLEGPCDSADKEVIDTITNNDKVKPGLCSIDKRNTLVLLNENENSQLTDLELKDTEVSNKNVIDDIGSSHGIPLESSDVDIMPSTKENIPDIEVEDQTNLNNEGQSTEVGQEINNIIISKEIREKINFIDDVSEHTTSNKLATIPNSESTFIDKMTNNENTNTNENELKEKSDGELSDRDSSEVEASDFKPDVVCISDDEEKKAKKKKKKDKKSKKVKKSKKKKDFRECADQNFFRETIKNVPNYSSTSQNEVVLIPEVPERCDSSSKSDIVALKRMEDIHNKGVISISGTEINTSQDIKFKEIECLKSEVINTDTDVDDDVYEILELSDNSSCYEVEEISISKEPTAKEIEALSAKLDELDSVRAIDSKILGSGEPEELGNVSWKDRYLKSSKVKKVLTTSNIINAMRKKNLRLKKKLRESKQNTETEESNKKENVKIATSNVEDGSIEQYNTLETSTKYVDPVKEVNELEGNSTAIQNADGLKITEDKNGTDNNGKAEKGAVTKEMKKEAKQLLKMYKMLLKYNDMTKQKDPNKKRKKKKKSKDKEKSVVSHVDTIS